VFSEVGPADEAKITHLGDPLGFVSRVLCLHHINEVEGSIPWRRKGTRRS